MGPWKYSTYTLSVGEDGTPEASAPVVLYSVVAANSGAADPATVGIYNGSGSVVAMSLVVPAGGTVVWSGCLAMAKGLQVYMEAGAGYVTVMYV